MLWIAFAFTGGYGGATYLLMNTFRASAGSRRSPSESRRRYSALAVPSKRIFQIRNFSWHCTKKKTEKPRIAALPFL